MITKFPPIQGGIASKSYWLARGLAESGVEIDIVTNANCVEPEYRIEGCDDHLSNLGNIRVHGLSGDIPWHIPFSKDYSLRLLNKVLTVFTKYKIEILDSGFLVPYGIVAFLASKLTGLPYILRHGGSDIEKFFGNYEYRYLLKDAIKNAAAVITDNPRLFINLNKNIITMPTYIPNSAFFKPSIQNRLEYSPSMVYFGKINYYWSNKNLLQLLQKSLLDNPNYKIIFIAQGIGINNFKEIVKKKNIAIEFKPFIPPWEMPQLMAAFNNIMITHDKTIPTTSNVLHEALSMQNNILTLDKQAFIEATALLNKYTYKQWVMDNYQVLQHVKCC